MADPRGRHVTLQKTKEDSDPDSMHHGGSFKKYMQFKQQKLREQFVDEQEAEIPASRLFAGISIHVNGFTTPTHQELRQMMAAHGGTFEVYYTRQRVTHIICSNLPNAKIKALQKERDSTPIVRPEWIVDSLQAGKVLPHNGYLLWRLRDKPGQATLGAFDAQPHSRSSALHDKSAAEKGHQPAFVPVSAIKGQPESRLRADTDTHCHPPTPCLLDTSPEKQEANQDAFHPHSGAGIPEFGSEKRCANSARLDYSAHGMDVVPDSPIEADPDSPVGTPNLALDVDRSLMVRLSQENAIDSTTGTPGVRDRQNPPAFAQTTEGPRRPKHSIESNHDLRANAAKLLTNSAPFVSRPREVQPEHYPAPLGMNSSEPPHRVCAKTYTQPSRGDIPEGCQIVQLQRNGSGGDSQGHPCHHGNNKMLEQPVEHSSLGWQRSLEQASPATAPKKEHEEFSAPGHMRNPPKGNLVKAQKVAAACRASCDLLKGAPKSSREDPKFMDNYYKSSRLHFIGTWKARIEALAMADPARAKARAQASSNKHSKHTILHLDMDCFFASVAALTDPSLHGLPLAVCHSNSSHGTGEVSSANYQARDYGVRAVMGIGEAKRLCPDLIVMPYQYEQYQIISEQVYKVLLQVTPQVQPISCDEAFLDVTGLGDPQELASAIRDKIFKMTGCSASVGISHNMLLARLATKVAKPNGQHLLDQSQVDQHLLSLEVGSLPGVGWAMRQKLEVMGIQLVADVRQSSEANLQKELGSKNGSSVWAASHGLDDREVEPMKLRRSVGAEVNWGIRFTSETDAETFLEGIAGEVHSRMVEAGVKGKCISLKLKRRKSDAPEPYKFLGHGACDNVSRSVTLNRFTQSAADLTSEAKTLLKALRIPATQIRGIGISVSKLDNDPANVSSSLHRMTLPQPAQPPSVFRPRSRAAMGEIGFENEQSLVEPRLDQEGLQHHRQPSNQPKTKCHDLEMLKAAPGETMRGDPPRYTSMGPPSLGRIPSQAQQGAPPLDIPGVEPGQGGGNLDLGETCTEGACSGVGRESLRGPPGTPIQALPPASQLDPSVLEALPLQMRREIEQAYGIGVRRAGDKRKRGVGRPVGESKHLKRNFTETTQQAHASGRFAPAVDKEVLKELPLEVQQQVADEMARINALASFKPPPQSRFVHFPAPEPEPPRVFGPVYDMTEDAKDVWGKIECAIESIVMDDEVQQSASLGAVDAGAVNDLGRVIVDHCNSLVQNNLEGLSYILKKLFELGTKHHVLVSCIQDWIKEIQENVGAEYNGMRL